MATSKKIPRIIAQQKDGSYLVALGDGWVNYVNVRDMFVVPRTLASVYIGQDWQPPDGSMTVEELERLTGYKFMPRAEPWDSDESEYEWYEPDDEDE